MAKRLGSTGGSGAMGWLFQRISGLVLVLLVIFHYFMMHIPVDPPRGHSYHAVYEALTGPYGPWWKMLDLTMLTLALWHGLYGTWAVIRDFQLRPVRNLLLLGALMMAGLAFGIMGFATILAF
jgi:succinate dehydrogenase / fumarate reductase, membrane anchor subunit